MTDLDELEKHLRGLLKGQFSELHLTYNDHARYHTVEQAVAGRDDDQTCASCKWWRASGMRSYEMEARGECRGAAPSMTVESKAVLFEPLGYRIWPITDREDYCAAHTPREEEAKADV